MLVTVKPTSLEWTLITICLVFIFVIDIFKAIQTRFVFGSFKSKRISFEIYFVASCHVLMMFNLVRSITLLTFEPINMTYKYSVFLLLAVFILGNTRVYIGISNHDDVLTNVEASGD